MSSVRPARREDWAAIAALCADTGAQGEPVDPSEREAFAERWIGPYRILCPEWGFVAEEGGKIAGYVVASPDTLTFERRVVAELKPTPDSRGFFGTEFLTAFWRDNPGHVHMNVAKEHRSKGLGGKLLELTFAEMRRVGVNKVHVFCGGRAKGYWEKAGFALVRSCEPRPGVLIHALARAT